MKDLRTFEVRNIRLETKESEGKKYLVGIIPYNSRSLDLGGFTEVVTPTAFNKTLNDKKNVRALLDHKKDKIIADVKSGTLSLESRSDGLVCTVEVPNTTYALDAYELMSRGIGNAMSFGFYPVKDTKDNETRTRFLNEVKLEEVSFLISEDPAYPATNAKTLVRSIAEDVEEIKAESISEDDRKLLQQIKENIEKILPVNNEAIETNKEAAEQKPSEQDTSINEALLLEFEIEQLINN